MHLRLEEVHRFPHRAQMVGGDLVWDLDDLLEQVDVGLAKAFVAHDLRSVAVDTWGVDYVLLTKGGERYGEAHTYRDPRTSRVAREFYARAGREERWRLTGVKPDDINTSNQLFADLVADPDLPESVERVLLLPDFFAYRLSGELGWGRSIASTSGLCEPGGARWSAEIFARGGIPDRWFGPVQPDVAVRGMLRPGPHTATAIAARHAVGGRPAATQVVSAAGHDTACAVHAIPKMGDDDAAFISSGSWSIVGIETAEPVLSALAFDANFTNEARADGGNRLLANITGLWILQECQRQWRESGVGQPIAELLALAACAESLGFVVDPGDVSFASPGDMPATIATYCQHRYGRVPDSRGQLVRLVLESLAVCFAASLRTIEQLVDRRLDVVHLVGGGAYNALLCQMTASAAGMSVIAGPAEASAVGNLLAQFEAAGVITSQRQRHEIVRTSFSPVTYAPGRQDRWLAMEERQRTKTSRNVTP